MNEILFENDNTLIGERTESELKKEVEEWVRTVDTSRCGSWTNYNIAVFDMEYRGVPFLIKILGHGGLSHDGVKVNCGMNDLGKWAVVEYDSKTLGELVDAITANTNGCEFLYHDSLHSGMEHWTLRRQVDEMLKWAHDDINALLDGEIELGIIETFMKNEIERLVVIKAFIATIPRNR